MSEYATETTEYTPTRAQTVQADVLVPLAWSFVAGILLGGAAGIIAAWLDWEQPAKAALIVGGVTMLGAFFTMSADVHRSWWANKTSTATPIEMPTPAQPKTRVVDRPVLLNARRAQAEEATDISMAEFVRGCDVGGTAEDRWLRVIGERQYDRWRDALIGAGWAEWNNKNGTHNNGWRLTAPASKIVEAMDGGPACDVYEMVADCLRGWW